MSLNEKHNLFFSQNASVWFAFFFDFTQKHIRHFSVDFAETLQLRQSKQVFFFFTPFSLL